MVLATICAGMLAIPALTTAQPGNRHLPALDEPAGGWTEAKVNDKQIVTAARFAVKQTKAKHKRLIPAIRPILDALQDRAGFRISQALYLRVLQDAGES